VTSLYRPKEIGNVGGHMYCDYCYENQVSCLVKMYVERRFYNGRIPSEIAARIMSYVNEW
jgi:hypothetical protein